MKTSKKNTDASITILIIARDTLMELRHSVNSVIRAAKKLQNVTATIFIFDEDGNYGDHYHVDNQSIRIIHTRKSIESITHNYIFIVPPLTMVSGNWLADGIDILLRDASVQLIRPQLQVVWDDQAVKIIEQQATLSPLYSLLSPVYSGVIGTRKDLFQHQIHTPLGDISTTNWLADGLGWLDYSSTILADTAALTYDDGASAVTYPHLESFGITKAKDTSIPTPEQQRGLPDLAHRRPVTVHARAATIKTLKKLHLAEPVKRLLTNPRHEDTPPVHTQLPEWLLHEWRELHRIDNRTFPMNHLVTDLRIIKDVPLDHKQVAFVYASIATQLNKNHYDYIFFAPWLMRGGADKFTINYANTIAEQRPDLNVLVITTLNYPSIWTDKLSQKVDYCDFGALTKDIPKELQLSLLTTITAQTGARTVHVINSELAYDWVYTYKNWLRETSVRVVATSFSQEVIETGRVLGYSHSHMPEIYDSTALITTDNTAVTSMWQDDYGFDPSKLLVHHLAQTSSRRPTARKKKVKHDDFRIVWASRLSVEKIPHLVSEIGAQLQQQSFSIDMYGTKTHNFDDSFLNTLPPNVHYKGAFNNIDLVPLEDYDAFLYTSLFDGMPNILLEVGLAGMAVIASAVGGIPELIHDHTTGILIPDAQDATLYTKALLELKENPRLRGKLGDNLQQKITQEYSPKQFEASVRDLLSRLGY